MFKYYLLFMNQNRTQYSLLHFVNDVNYNKMNTLIVYFMYSNF